jgi:hypothetical protein
MPKNASTTVSAMFERNKVHPVRLDEADLSDRQVLVILRNPIQRWQTGIVEQLLTTTGIQYYEQLAKDTNTTPISSWWDKAIKKIRLDPHTDPQITFINQIGHTNIRYFIMELKLSEYLDRWFYKHKLPFETAELFSNKNASKGNALKQAAWYHLYDKYNGEIEQRVKEYYAKDIELYNMQYKLQEASVDRDLKKS